MTGFVPASLAVEAALAAGARYADARVMHRRTESMDARNGEIEDLNQGEDAGVGVRALVGSSWGFFAVPDLSDCGGPASRRTGSRDRRRQRHRCPGPPVDLVAVAGDQRQLGLGLRGRPARRAAVARRATCWSRSPRPCSAAGADQAEGSYNVWDTRKWFVSSEGHRIDQHIRECGAGISATAIGDGETQRRSYPSYRGQYGTRGWELVDRARPGRARRADRRARPGPC